MRRDDQQPEQQLGFHMWKLTGSLAKSNRMSVIRIIITEMNHSCDIPQVGCLLGWFGCSCSDRPGQPSPLLQMIPRLSGRDLHAHCEARNAGRTGTYSGFKLWKRGRSWLVDGLWMANNSWNQNVLNQWWVNNGYIIDGSLMVHSWFTHGSLMIPFYHSACWLLLWFQRCRSVVWGGRQAFSDKSPNLCWE